MLQTRIKKLNDESTKLLIETSGVCIQMASGKEMGDINWTGLLAKYTKLLEESMRYNQEFAETIDMMNRKLDLLIDNMD